MKTNVLFIFFVCASQAGAASWSSWNPREKPSQPDIIELRKGEIAEKKKQRDEKEQMEKRQLTESASRERLRRLYKEKPAAFFSQVISGRYSIAPSGEWVRPMVISGKVMQIVSPTEILMIMGDGIKIVCVKGYDTSRWIDGQRLELEVQDDGRIQYETVLRAVSTIIAYKKPRMVLFADFVARSQKKDLSEIPW